MTGTQHKIELIPWDCESDEHVERMYQQRIACGWRSDEVHKQWVDLTRAGEKMLYWAVSPDPVSLLVSLHAAVYCDVCISMCLIVHDVYTYGIVHTLTRDHASRGQTLSSK